MRTRAITPLLIGLWVAAAGLLPGLALGQSNPGGAGAKPIGKVVNAAGSVTIEHSSAVIVQANLPAGGSGRAKADDVIYQGDIIQTGADGNIAIIFADGTTFNVSKNARMELNEFVYDPKSTSNSTLIKLKKGAFTFLAGKVAKTGDMKVETPVGTMGIRGTAPHVEILDDGTTKFTTLIEENGKGGQGPAPATTPPLRKAQSPTPDASAIQKAEIELQKKLNICRGC